MSPVVGKAMEATLVVLYLGAVTATLYGGVVPEYRAATGGEIADRTLADAATDIEAAIPPETEAATVRRTVEMPATIAGSAYRIHAKNDSLILEHPSPEVSTRTPLVLPERIEHLSGTWASGETAVVRIVDGPDGLEIRLE